MYSLRQIKRVIPFEYFPLHASGKGGTLCSVPVCESSAESPMENRTAEEQEAEAQDELGRMRERYQEAAERRRELDRVKTRDREREKDREKDKEKEREKKWRPLRPNT